MLSYMYNSTVIILASEICIGPNSSFAGNIYDSRVKLMIFAMANNPSATLCGSQGSQ